MTVASGGACPTFKNVTCFGRWAKAHPTLLRSFGTPTSAGIRYGEALDKAGFVLVDFSADVVGEAFGAAHGRPST